MSLELREVIEQAGHIALVCHVSPDMDTLGSAVALKIILQRMGKEVVIYDQDDIPERYCFLEGVRDVCKPDDRVYDLCISVDVSDVERMGTAATVFNNARRTALIDHHRTTQPFAPIYVIEPTAAAAAQIVVNLCDQWGWEIPQSAAMCLCAGLSTDTGNFSFDSVTGDTFRAAARCMDQGAKINVINEELYNSSSEARIRMMGRLLNGLQLHADGRVAIMQVTLADMQELSAAQVDTDGIVNYGLQIPSVQTAALVSEREGIIKCSLRAKAPLDVAAVASRFNGGGHILASGCSFTGMTMEEAKCAIVGALTEIVQ